MIKTCTQCGKEFDARGRTKNCLECRTISLYPCNCGCGEIVTSGKLFINGHQNRGKSNPMYGKHHSEKSRKSISENHIGIGHTEETKAVLSQKSKGNQNALGSGQSKMGNQNAKGKNWTLSLNQRLKKVGYKNPAWKGGVARSPYPPEYEMFIKPFIRYRDRKYHCANPDCLQTNWVRNIHHIDYHKFNCTQKNLTTLCQVCHAQTNFNRTFHKNYYQNLTQR